MAGKRTGGKRSQKDPNAPKRPLSSYMLFAREERVKIVQERPALNSKVAEVGKLIGGTWKGMTPEDKAPYEKLAQEEKAKYQELVRIYKEKRGA